MFEKLETVTKTTLGGLLAASALAMMFLTVVDVIGRSVFGLPLDGANEMVEFALAICVSAGLPLVALASSHVTVSFLQIFKRHRWFGTLKRLIEAVGFLISLLVSYALWLRADFLQETGEHSQVLNVPVWILAGALSVFWCIATLAGLRVAFRRHDSTHQEPDAL